MQRLIVALFGALASSLLMWAGTGESNAATFTVTKTADANDGTCDADCSLREAVIAANQTPGADAVILPAGTYRLTIGGAEEDAAATGDLDVTSEVSITGEGRDVTVIEADGTDRVLHVHRPDGLLTLSAVTVANGGAVHLGGGILVQGSLVLTDSRVSGNSAAYEGGGIDLNIELSGDLRYTGTAVITGSIIENNWADYGGGGIDSYGLLEITDSTLNDNWAGYQGGSINLGGTGELVMLRSTVSGNGAGYEGGGIATESSWLGTAIATIVDSTLEGNFADYEGGSISNSGLLEITDSTIGDSSAGYSGGGIDVDRRSGELTMQGSVVSGNSAGYEGGGINNYGLLEITDSTISDNSADYEGGGISVGGSGELDMQRSTVRNNHGGGGGGIQLGRSWLGMAIATIVDSTIDGNIADYNGGGISNGGHLTVIASTISNNEAGEAGSSGGNGGGIATSGSEDAQATLTLMNATVSGNRAFSDGGGIAAVDGEAPVVLNNVTVANNVADFDGDGIGDGGGLAGTDPELELDAVVMVGNTILAANADTGGEAPDCSGTLASQGYNLIEDPAGCTISGDTTGVLTGVDPDLGPLQDNGGPTLTHALGPVSAAIDAASPAVPGSGGNACEATDQRGLLRPGGLSCDIGAYEVDGSTPPRTGTGVQRPASGNLLLMRNPKNADPSKRKIIYKVKERGSANTVVGDPTAYGAKLKIRLDSTTDCYDMPASGWSRMGTGGFKYKDSAGANGPVVRASIKSSPSGVFQIKAMMLGRHGLITVVRSSPGIRAHTNFSLGGGDEYCSMFGGTIRPNTARMFRAKNAPAPTECHLTACSP